MKISICTLTARRGFADIQAKLIANQDYPKDQLEWIFVDFVYEERVKKLKDLANGLNLTMKHIPNVRDNKLYFRDITRNRNLALREATGDAVIFLDDYAVIPRNFVSSHREILATNSISAGRMFRLELPIPNLEESVGIEGSPVSFANEGNIACILEKYKDNIGKDYRDRGDDKFYKGTGITYTGNLGIPRVVFEELNGFDVRMESGLEDCDFGLRATLSNFNIFYNPAGFTINFDVGHAPYTFNFDHFHDVEPFICNPNNNFRGDDKLPENETIRVHFHPNYRIAECKICGATGMIDPNELMNYKAQVKETVAPEGLPGGYR